jgi:hypothetical protein
MRGALISEWPAIRTAVLSKLESFVIDQEAPAPNRATIKYFP